MVADGEAGYEGPAKGRADDRDIFRVCEGKAGRKVRREVIGNANVLFLSKWEMAEKDCWEVVRH